MLVKISRYILITVAILVASVFIPGLYWKAFDTKVVKPFISYSAVNHNFIMRKHVKGKTTMIDNKGNTYTRKEYEKALPLMNCRQLMALDQMPDSVNGEEVDFHDIHRENFFKRMKAADFHKPEISLHPLFESRPGRIKLEMPTDYFRINSSIEFIDAKSNSILKNKSKKFNDVLVESGFSFPAKTIAGIPTTRKSCDEGYFIIDNADKLFHLKMIKGEPYVVNVPLPEDIAVENIVCMDMRNKEFYAFLFTRDSRILIVKTDEYELAEIPAEGYDKSKHEIRINGNMFYRLVTIYGNGFVISHVMNRDYELIDTYKEEWSIRDDKIAGKIAANIFPFAINLKKGTSYYIDLYCNGYNICILNLIIALIFGFMLYRKNKVLKNYTIDLIIILITGVFGLIATKIFPFKNR